MIEAGGEEDILDGQLLNWVNPNLNYFEDDYSSE